MDPLQRRPYEVEQTRETFLLFLLFFFTSIYHFRITILLLSLFLSFFLYRGPVRKKARHTYADSCVQFIVVRVCVRNTYEESVLPSVGSRGLTLRSLEIPSGLMVPRYEANRTKIITGRWACVDCSYSAWLAVTNRKSRRILKRHGETDRRTDREREKVNVTIKSSSLTFKHLSWLLSTIFP